MTSFSLSRIFYLQILKGLDKQFLNVKLYIFLAYYDGSFITHNICVSMRPESVHTFHI